MIGIFRHNNPFALILLLVLAYVSLFLKHEIILPFSDIKHTLLLTNLMKWLGPIEAQNMPITKIFKYLLLITEALYINKIARDNKLLEKSTYVVAMTFLLICFLIPFKISLFILLINALILIAVDSFIKMYKKNNPFNNIILSGFIISITSSLTNNYLIFYCWLTIALLVIRPTSLREWTVLNIGFILPYYFLMSILYLFDQFSLDAIIQFKMPILSMPELSTIASLKLILLVLLPILGLTAGSSQINKMILQNRKAYIIIFALFLAAVLITMVNLNQLSEYAYLMLLPASILFAPFFQAFRKDFIPNLVLIVLIALSYIR
ncbi:MAG: hypothetical protein RI965_139 [Bacteroidota bacterium]